MAALALLLLITTALCHWLLEPFLALGTWLFNLALLPWLLLGVGGWLLAGRPSGDR